MYSGEIATYRAASLEAPLPLVGAPPVRLTGRARGPVTTAWGYERPAPGQSGPVREGAVLWRAGGCDSRGAWWQQVSVGVIQRVI